MELTSHYPIIKIPENLYNPAIEPNKPKAPLEPIKPTPPKKPTGSIIILFIGLVICIYLSFLVIQKDFIENSFGTLVKGLWLINILFFGRFIIKGLFSTIGGHKTAKQRYISDLEEYYELQKEYPKQLLQYGDRLSEYNKTISKIKNDPNYKKWLVKNARLENLKMSKLPVCLYQKERETKGISEDFFFEYLKKYFGNKIYASLKFPYAPGDWPYYPDFTYWDKDTNLLIDIEIDEPYTSNKEVPIHCINYDEFRDSNFIEEGWLIIKFTEWQVIKYPNECCHVINSLVQNIFSKETIDNISIPMQKEKKWTKEEAIEMKKRDYRDSYLPKNLKIKQKTIIEESIDLKV